MSLTYLQYYCSISGILCVLLFFLGLVAAGFVPPPIKPTWTAEETAAFYRDHTIGMQAGAGLLLISGMFYLPLSAAISYQMSTIPGLPSLIHRLQLASAAAGIFTFLFPAIALAVLGYRLDRPVEITQALSDLFWISTFIAWPTFMVQNFAYAFAILWDRSEKPVFPKWLAALNFAVPFLYTPVTGLHCVYGGPLAWDGAWTFWLVGLVFGVELVIDSVCVFLAARGMDRREARGDVESPISPAGNSEKGFASTISRSAT